MLLITSAIRRGCLLGLSLALALMAGAQAYLHVDADAYLKERTPDPFKPIGEPVGDFVDLYPSLGQWTLLFIKDGKERKVRCKDIWGFTYKGVLFRINDEGPIPVRLMVEGSLCYYENGMAHLIMQRDSTEIATFDIGHASYLSKDIKGAIVPAIFKDGDTRSVSGRFRTEYPKMEALFNCIGTHDEMDPIRQCVVDHEAGLMGQH
ncbi:MAG: hypothetical protein IPO56_14165 [Flavobacteriales bacterium]|nr:hypothetical protein [Flavobacteriales bacterium]